MVSKYPFKPYYPVHELTNKIGYYHQHMKWSNIPKMLKFYIPIFGFTYYVLNKEFDLKHHAVYSRAQAIKKQSHAEPESE